MSEYGYDYQPAPGRAARTDHGRVVTSGAWIGAAAATAALGWLDMRMPAWCAFLLNWTVVLAVCYGMARWKRAWYAWLAFWGMAAICPVAGILQLAGLMGGMSSAAVWWVASAMVFVWYWLIRMPRLRGAAEAIERREIHVFHHVIHHGQELPGWTAEAVPAEDARKVTAGEVRAISPPRRDLLARARDAIAGDRMRRRP
jgi:hypothetical protein